MIDVLKTNDIVLLSFIQSVLDDAGIPCLVLDTHMSVIEGSLGILPRRLMVADEDADRARRLIEDALKEDRENR